MVVSGAEGEVSVSKVNPCGICGKRVMANSVLCVKWIHGRCVKSKEGDLQIGERFCVWKMQEASRWISGTSGGVV